MTLEELYFDELISTRTFNVCKKVGLNNVSDIQSYYRQNGNFLLLTNLGEKSYGELMFICNSEQFSQKKFEWEQNKNNDIPAKENDTIVTIEELLNTKRISVRTYNFCLCNDLATNQDIINYYRKHGSFFRLRNCGKISNNQLKEFYLEELHKFPVKVVGSLNILQILDNVNDEQKQIIENIFSLSFSNLSVRTKNSVIKAITHKINPQTFLQKFPTQDQVRVLKLENAGVKTVEELVKFRIKIEEIILKYAAINDRDTLRKNFNYFAICEHFGDDSLFSSPEETSSIILILDKLIQQNKLLDDNESFIIKNCNRIYLNSEYLTLTEAGEQLNLTRERVRQIRQKTFDTLHEIFGFIKNLSDPILEKILIENNVDYLAGSDVSLIVFSEENNLNLTPEFIVFICSIYGERHYDLVGSYKDVLMVKDFKFHDKYNWRKLYLLRREIFEVFDSERFLHEFEKRLRMPYKYESVIDLEDYINTFIGENAKGLKDRILKFAKVLLENELSVKVGKDNKISFHRTSYKAHTEYMLDALVALGKPASAEQIFAYCKEHFPSIISNVNSIGPACHRNDQIITVGRTSTYALKIWEIENSNFKGGTILKMVEEFLQDFNEPQHLSVIEKFVKHYRPETNSKNIYNNLRVDPKKTFTFFKNSHVGLCYRIYDGKFQLWDPKVDFVSLPWSERFQQLKSFVINHNRLPVNSSRDGAEVALYRWMKVQKTHFKAGKITEERVKPLLEFLSTLPDSMYSPYSRLTSVENYSKLLAFITKENRFPKSGISSEYSLYLFWHKQKKAYKEGRLIPEELKLYNDILSIFESGSQLSFGF